VDVAGKSSDVARRKLNPLRPASKPQLVGGVTVSAQALRHREAQAPAAPAPADKVVQSERRKSQYEHLIEVLPADYGDWVGATRFFEPAEQT
jgi:hypothetical protein